MAPHRRSFSIEGGEPHSGVVDRFEGRFVLGPFDALAGLVSSRAAMLEEAWLLWDGFVFRFLCHSSSVEHPVQDFLRNEDEPVSLLRVWYLLHGDEVVDRLPGVAGESDYIGDEPYSFFKELWVRRCVHRNTSLGVLLRLYLLGKYRLPGRASYPLA